MLTDLLSSRTWAMEHRALQGLMHQIEGLAVEIETASALSSTQIAKPRLQVSGDEATIPIHGVVLKAVPWWFAVFGIEATGTEDARRLIAEAVADEKVKRISLDVDSPGGTIDGVQSLAEDIRAARDSKPVTAHIADMGASAAYWIASQATKVTAGSSAAVGSIGVYTTLVDTSAAAEAEGVKVHVISSHELKGTGVPGAPLTEAQRADVQRVIDSYTSVFVDAVAKGRGKDAAEIRELATGQVWVGREAKKKGLVDAIARDRADPVESADEPAEPIEQTTTPAPLDANQESQMAESEKIAALTAELEQLKARVGADDNEIKALRLAKEASDAAAANAKAGQRDALLTKYRDRINPSALAQVKAYGEKVEPGDFEAFLVAMPVQTRPDPVGSDGGAPAASSPVTQKLTEDEALVARTLGMTPAEFVSGQNIKRVTWDGKAIGADGEVI